MKKCNVCATYKQLSDFYRSKAEIDGHCHTCKLCAKDRVTRWQIHNSDKVNYNSRKYRAGNRAKRVALCRSYRSQKEVATPKWITPDDWKSMEEFYKTAKELQWLSEEPLHVDHVVPLNGDSFSGLHVPWNLQILPASANIKKGNRL